MYSTGQEQGFPHWISLLFFFVSNSLQIWIIRCGNRFLSFFFCPKRSSFTTFNHLCTKVNEKLSFAAFTQRPTFVNMKSINYNFICKFRYDFKIHSSFVWWFFNQCNYRLHEMNNVICKISNQTVFMEHNLIGEMLMWSWNPLCTLHLSDQCKKLNEH